MPHQLDLKEETVSDVMRKMARYLEEKTRPLGNDAFAVLMGDPDLYEEGKRLDEVALTGDVQATKAAARKYIQVALHKTTALDKPQED